MKEEEKDIKIELEGYENIQVEKESIQEERKYRQDNLVVVYCEERIRHMCVSDNMILAYIYIYDGGGTKYNYYFFNLIIIVYKIVF